MKWYFVNVEDRTTHECVCVGAMLTINEVHELISCLEKFNSTDILIYKKEEQLLK